MNNYDRLPQNIKDILNSFDEDNNHDYKENKRIVKELHKFGYSVNYDFLGEFTELFSIGDFVTVSDPEPDDLHNHSFCGHITSISEFITVQDGEGNHYDLEPYQLTLAE